MGCKKELPQKWHSYIYTICPVCRKEDDTTEDVLDCEVELEKGKHTIGSSNKPLETDTKDI